MKLHAIGLQLNEKRYDYNAYDPNAYGPFWNHKHKSMQMMQALHKLTLNKQLARSAKRCALVQRNCVLFYLIFNLIYIWYFSFKGKESSLIWIIE